MKHFYPYFAVMAMLFAIGCDKDNTEENTNGSGGNGKPGTECTLSVDPGSTTISARGDTFSTVVSSSAGWTLSGGVSWCEPSKTNGGNGETVTFTIEPNTTPSDRNVTYTFRCGNKSAKLTITQKQKDALTVTQSKYEVDAGGDDIRVEVKANIPFDYEIAPNCKEWITPLQTKALTTSTLVFKIAENPETSRREGTIVIRSGDLSETISVYQAGATPAIVISRDKYIVPDEGETIKVEVNSNVEYTVEMPAVDWITENAARSVSSHTHYYTISPNESYDQRSAQIIFKSKENSALQQVVTVTQVQKDALVLAEKTSRFDSDGGTLTVEVRHNVDFDVEIGADGKQWIQQIVTRALETDRLTFSIARNTAPDNREGTIVFRSKDGSIEQTHTVYQGQKDAIILSRKEVNLSDERQTFSVEISANVDFEVTTSEAAWLHPIETRALVSHTLNYSVDANETYDERFATITVRNTQNGIEERITVVQAQKDAIILGKDSYTVSPAGEALNLEVKSNVDYTVTVNDNWIHHIQTKALQTSTVHLTVDPNPEPLKIRMGSITLSADNVEQRITVTQMSTDIDDSQIIYYTTSDNQPIKPHPAQSFGANIIANLYDDGKGIWIFDAPITQIGDKPYEYTQYDNHYYRTLCNIVIPESVTSIGEYALQGSGITHIDIPESVTSFGKRAFSGCDRLEEISLPQNMTTINEGMFSGCEKLKHIDIPKSVTTIGVYAFDGSGLESIVIPDNVREISAMAFRQTNLTSVVIPDNVVTMSGHSTFYECKRLTTVHIGSGLQEISERGFFNCSNLKTISFSDNCQLKAINRYCFQRCNITMDSLVLPNSVETISYSAFQECKIRTISGKGVKSISCGAGGETLGSPEYLESVDFPNATQIDKNLFAGYTRLKQVNLPNVQTIGSQAFSGCSNLKNLVLGNVVSCGENTFEGCTGTLSIQGIAEGIYSFQESKFSDIIIRTGENGNTICDYAFAESRCQNVTIEPNVILGSYVFSGCTSLTSITILEGVTEIGSYVFSGCTGLTSITIPESVTEIGESTFEGCTGLTSITIPESVTEIGQYAFYGCEELSFVKLPTSVVVIRSYAFAATGLSGVLHPLAVTVGAEQLDGVVRGPVGLQALKDLLGVVEDDTGGIQREGLIGDDAGIIPALAGGVVHQEHVVGEDFAEAKLALVRGLFLGTGGLGDFDIQHVDRSLKCSLKFGR